MEIAKSDKKSLKEMWLCEVMKYFIAKGNLFCPINEK